MKRISGNALAAGPISRGDVDLTEALGIGPPKPLCAQPIFGHPIDRIMGDVRMDDGVTEEPAGTGIVIDDIAHCGDLTVLENILTRLPRSRSEQSNRGLARAKD